MNKELESIKQMVEELQTNDSMFFKQEVLRKFPENKELLRWVYDPFKLFWVTKENVEKQEELINLLGEGSHRVPTTVIKLLEDLHKENIPRGNHALDIIVSCINRFPEHKEIILNILDKDLGCGISVKTINKIYPGLIPEFNVPLAYKYEGQDLFSDGSVWYASRKLDGVRCLCFMYSKENIKFFSRSGKEITTLNNLKKHILENWKGCQGFILDGEVCIVDENNNENFSSIIKEIRRKDHTIDYPKFFVFDNYPIKNFEEGSSKVTFSQKNIFNAKRSSDQITWLPQTILSSTKDLQEMIEKIPPCWEGIMLRKDVPTEFKRSRNLLKVKKFQEDEYVVKGIDPGLKKINGQEQSCCGSLVISHKGYRVKVGSGLSDEQRLTWIYFPEQIVGKTITVKYFEETVDQNGELSLRFPTLKVVWQGDKI